MRVARVRDVFGREVCCRSGATARMNRTSATPTPSPLFLFKVFIPGWLGLDLIVQSLESKGGGLVQGLHS